MVHQTTVPPPADGGNGLVAGSGGSAKVVVAWIPPHDISPREERRRIEKADRMRLEIEAMLDAPADSAEA